MSERVVWCISAMQHFGRLAARVTGADLVMDDYVPACDVVHIVGMYDPPIYQATLEATKAAKRRVIHWCGTDVQLLQHPHLLPEATHVCDSDGLRRELSALGVDATTIPWPAVNHFEATPLPEKPSVAVYFGGSAEKYGAPMVAAVQEMLPDVPFETYMFGHFDAEGMQGVIDRASVYLRLTTHDGGAMSAKEFMEAGRRAVVTEPLPHATQVRADDLLGVVTALQSALSEGGLDAVAADYWRQQNSDERFLDQLTAVW